MKGTKKRIALLLVFALTLVFTLGFITACGGDENGDGAKKTYTFEAEGINFDGLSGFGYSLNVSETGMILGKHVPGIPENVLSTISNGYFVGYFNTPNTTLMFNITADKASTDNTLMLRLGSEYGTLAITPSDMEVLVNDVALDYNTIEVIGINVTDVNDAKGYTVPFQDYTLSAAFGLNAGVNTVKIRIKQNKLGIADSLLESVGPGVDCIKIKSESVLSWESLWEENKLQEDIK